MGEDSEEEPVLVNGQVYGSTDSEERHLNDVYEEIGVGPAQYLYWIMIGLIAYSDYAAVHLVAILIHLLRCEWELSLIFEAAITCSVFTSFAAASLIFGSVSDIYGRKRVMSYTLILLLVAAVGAAVSQNKWQFIFFRCVIGACIGANHSPLVGFGAEIVKNSYRSWGVVVFVFVVHSSMFIVAFLAWIMLNAIGWRWFTIVVSIPIVPGYILLMFLPESPRYLCVSGQKKEATEALVEIAKLNKVELSPNFTVTVYQNQELGSLRDVLSPKYRKNAIVLSVLSFANILMEYGLYIFVPLAFTSGFCGGSDKVQKHRCEKVTQDALWKILVVTFGALVGVTVGFGAASKIGRLLPLRISATLLFFSLLGLYHCFSLTVTFALLFWIKIVEGVLNTIVWIIIPEIFPTVIRTTATGFIQFWSKIGGVLGTGSVYLLFYVSPYAVVTVFAVSGFIVLACAFIFDQETVDIQLQDINSGADYES